MTSRRSGAVSRANMVHGSAGAQDSWYDVDAFMLDQVKEVLSKLSDGSIDDEIWGKIVIMERCKRVAKAYLRKTTVIVDGSEEEFDGRTLGFNYFHNSERDDHGEEIRAKIADGVILKMDLQGNIKGMARGAAPIVCQGWRGERHNCVSDRLIRQQGRLNATANEEEKAHKLFDMRKFKHSLEREIHEEMPDARSLLLKTCVRVALVKDGVDMPRTPCWFAIVNLVALDMLKEKIPNLRELLRIEPSPSAVVAAEVPAPTANPAMSQEALTQLIAAAVNQINKAGMTNVSADQISQLASTLNISSARSEATTINKRDRSRKPYHFSSSSLDSSGEDMTLFRNVEAPVIKPQKTKRAEPVPKTYSSEDFYDSGMEKTREKEKKKPSRAFPSRPRLHDALFTRSQSITSDYDSNREQFDSGSWSSTNSRGYKQDHSTSSSLASEFELIPREERVEPLREHREEEKKTSIPIVADKPSAPIILTLQVNSTSNQEKPDDIIKDVNRYSIDNGDQTYSTEETPILTGQTSKTGQLSPNLGNSPKSDRIENQRPIYDHVCEEIYGSFSDKTEVECSENEAPPTIKVLPSMANEENDSGEVILASAQFKRGVARRWKNTHRTRCCGRTAARPSSANSDRCCTSEPAPTVCRETTPSQPDRMQPDPVPSPVTSPPTNLRHPLANWLARASSSATRSLGQPSMASWDRQGDYVALPPSRRHTLDLTSTCGTSTSCGTSSCQQPAGSRRRSLPAGHQRASCEQIRNPGPSTTCAETCDYAESGIEEWSSLSSLSI